MQLADLRSLRRDLLAKVERDLGTRLDRAAIDHWNTDNPHLHIHIRGKIVRRLSTGRAQAQERFGLGEQVAPGIRQLKPSTEAVEREFGDPGDIIRTMHTAEARGPERAA